MASFLDDVDLESDAKVAIPQDDKLAMLTNLADYYATTEAELADAEEALRIITERFRKLREELIPEKMKELGVKRFVLEDGSELGYKEFYAGRVLDERGYDWLEKAGYADAVKQELKLETNRTDRATLEAVRRYIESDHSLANLSVKEKMSIHHMTLGSVIKELTKRGEQLPPNLIETFIGNRATLKGAKNNG